MEKVIENHKDYKKWKSRLNFYQDEIRFFFKELNKVFEKDIQNLPRMEFIDEYEKILDKKLDKIEKLQHRIDLAEKSLIEISNEQLDRNHHQLNFDFLKFERSYLEMKQRFKMYASHND